MNLEVPYQDIVCIRSLIKSMGPCMHKQGLYALPLFPDARARRACVQDTIESSTKRSGHWGTGRESCAPGPIF